MSTHGEWSREMHLRIASAVKQARQGRFTTDQLADETKRLGYPISRSTLANYESGRKRHLDVAELIVLATALHVAPSDLLFPGDVDEPVELLPDHTVTSLQARSWFGANPMLDQLVRAITGEPSAGKRAALGGVVTKETR